MPEEKQSLAPYVAGGAGVTLGAGALAGGSLLAKKYGPAVIDLAKRLGTTVDEAAKTVSLVKGKAEALDTQALNEMIEQGRSAAGIVREKADAIDVDKVKDIIDKAQATAGDLSIAAKQVPRDISGATANIGKATESIVGAGESISRAGESLTGSGKAIEDASAAVAKRMESPLAGVPETATSAMGSAKEKLMSKLPFSRSRIPDDETLLKGGSALLDHLVLSGESHVKTAGDQFAEILQSMEKEAAVPRWMLEAGEGALAGGSIGAAGGGLTGMVAGSKEGKPGQGALHGALMGAGAGAGVGAGFRPLANFLARRTGDAADAYRLAAESASDPITRKEILKQLGKKVDDVGGPATVTNIRRTEPTGPTASTRNWDEIPRDEPREDLIQSIKDRINKSEGQLPKPRGGVADVVDISRKRLDTDAAPAVPDAIQAILNRRQEAIRDAAAEMDFYDRAQRVSEVAMPLATAGAGLTAGGLGVGALRDRRKKKKKENR